MRFACVAAIALFTVHAKAEDEVALVGKLASADAVERAHARAALLKSGKQAIAVLVRAQKHKDPEGELVPPGPRLRRCCKRRREADSSADDRTP